MASARVGSSPVKRTYHEYRGMIKATEDRMGGGVGGRWYHDIGVGILCVDQSLRPSMGARVCFHADGSVC